MFIKLALYKGKGNFEDTIIRWWTKSDYSHVEMIIKYKWVSSSPNAGGVTINDLSPLDYTDYDYIDIKVDGRKLKKVLKFIEDNNEAKYDWWGLVSGTIFNFDIEDKNKYFCSEMMTIILQLFGNKKTLTLIPHKTTPADLYNLFK